MKDITLKYKMKCEPDSVGSWQGPVAWFCEHSNQPLGFTKGGRTSCYVTLCTKLCMLSRL